MLKVTGMFAVKIGAIADGVHLVDLDPVQLGGTSFERVEYPNRLPVGDGDNQLRAGR
jgi:hypothetical protein